MEPFLGEIRYFGGNFAPVGWALCNGQTLSIAENDALFSLIGNTYGGDGVTNFAVPDLRGRRAVHAGGNYQLGQTGGSETLVLTQAQLPAHTHAAAATLNCSARADGSSPANAVPGGTGADFIYAAAANGTQMNRGAVTVDVAPAGNGAPAEIGSPYICVTFIIATEGIFPSQG